MAPIRANSNDDREGHSHHPCHMGRYQVEGHETAESLGGASQTLADHHLEGALEILDIYCDMIEYSCQVRTQIVSTAIPLTTPANTDSNSSLW
jgi:hypothetical protein